MGLRATVWGAAFVGGGLLLASDWLPGASSFEPGPRTGLVAGLLTLGAFVLIVGNGRLLLRPFTKPDEPGSCPVGAACAACGAFNRKGRKSCRHCRVDLAAAALQAQSSAQDQTGPSPVS